MGLFSSGKHHKHQAERYLNQARGIQDYQSEVEFRRQLLSNIRQERIARAQMQVRDYSPTYRSSTNEGFIANIDSSLAGEADYSYSSSIRQQQMTNLVDAAQHEYKKYQKAQKKRATAFSIGGLALGAITGGLGAAALGAGAATAGGAATGLGIAKGAMFGAQLGQGVGQIASGTGQTQLGIQNIINSAAYGYGQINADNSYDELIEAIRGFNKPYTTSTNYNRYEAISLDNNNKMMLNNAEQFLLPQPDGTTVKAVKGFFPC